jgi:hypothetical protein
MVVRRRDKAVDRTVAATPASRVRRNEIWLARVLEDRRKAGSIRFRGSAPPAARTLIGGLEGAMLVSRPYRDVKRFRDAAELSIRGLAVER